MHGWAPEVIGAVGEREASPQQYLEVFFSLSPSSRQAGQEVLGRIYARTQDRDAVTTWATREAQYDAVCTWGIPDHALLRRVSCLEMPVFVANGERRCSRRDLGHRAVTLKIVSGRLGSPSGRFGRLPGVIAKSPGQMMGGAAGVRCSSACNASRTAVSS